MAKWRNGEMTKRRNFEMAKWRNDCVTVKQHCQEKRDPGVCGSTEICVWLYIFGVQLNTGAINPDKSQAK